MAHDLSLSFPADEMALRDVLAEVTSFLQAHGISADRRGTVELVLAEAVNNVVEHAYADTARGQVDLRVDLCDGALRFSIEDDGAPMPGGAAPEGKQHDLECDLQDLPEGGFGWFLIRELTQNLQFSRHAQRNRLTFTISSDIQPQ